MGKGAQAGIELRLGGVAIRSQSGQDRLTRLPRIVSADAVMHGVLKIVWDDGHEGVVDLRPTIARGRIFTYLQVPENFAQVTVVEFGHGIGWVDDQGQEIDLDSHNLRLKSDNQAKLHHIAALGS